MNNPCSKVRQTCQAVFSSCKRVKINQNKVNEFIENLRKMPLKYEPWSMWHLDDPKQYSVEQITAYCFVVDAMNFCFWPNNQSGKFEYDSMTRNLEKVLIKDP